MTLVRFVKACEENDALAMHAALVGLDVQKTDRYKKTVLMWAAEKGHHEAVKILLEAGSDINRKSHGGWTALMLAVINGKKTLCER